MCDRHPPFDANQGDRATSRGDNGFARAIARARKITTARGVRQAVTFHQGPFFSEGVFYIQDADRVAAWRAAQEATR